MANSIEELNEKLAEIKTELVKIQVSQKYENKDKQIEILQNNIKSLEDKFHASEIAKNNIENNIKHKFDKYNSIIDRQDRRIEDFGSYITTASVLVTLFGILITIVLLFFGFNYEKDVEHLAKDVAKDEITNWLDTKADKEFEPKIQELLDTLDDKRNQVLDNIQIKEDKLNKELKQRIDNINISILEKEVIKKDKKDFTFNDWHRKFLIEVYNENYREALKYLDKALKIANNDEDKVKALYNKGFTLGMQGESQKAIDVYDILIKEFKGSQSEAILKQVAQAYNNKGERLGELGKLLKEIDVYDVLIKEFRDSKSEAVLEKIAQAYNTKGLILEELSKPQNAIKVYDILIKKFRGSKSEYILKQVAQAYMNKGIILEGLDKFQKAIDVFDVFIKEFKNSKSEYILELVKQAKDYKLLINNKRSYKSIAPISM